MTVDDVVTYALTSPNESDVIDANARIEQNAGIPTPDGRTPHWCDIRKALGHDFYFIYKPKADGWNGHTQEEMMQGVVNVDTQVFDPSWIRPPAPLNFK